jgi:hypothetical protein
MLRDARCAKAVPRAPFRDADATDTQQREPGPGYCFIISMPGASTSGDTCTSPSKPEEGI